MVFAAGDAVVKPDGTRGVKSDGNAGVRNASNLCDPCCVVPFLCPSSNACSNCPDTTPCRMRVTFSGVTRCSGGTCINCGSTSYRVNTLTMSGNFDLIQTGSCTWSASFAGLISYDTFPAIGCLAGGTNHTPSMTVTVTRTSTGYTVTATGAGGEPIFSGTSTTSSCETNVTGIANTITCSCTGPVLGSGGTASLTLCIPRPSECSRCQPCAGQEVSGCGGTDCDTDCTPQTIVATVSGITYADPSNCCSQGSFWYKLNWLDNPNRTIELAYNYSGACTWGALVTNMAQQERYGTSACSGSPLVTMQHANYVLTKASTGIWEFSIGMTYVFFGGGDFFFGEAPIAATHCKIVPDTTNEVVNYDGGDCLASAHVITSGGTATFDPCP